MNRRWITPVVTCLAVIATVHPGLADPVDDALARWDTTAARRSLPPLETADARSLARWGLLLFMEGDYARAEEALSRAPLRGQTASLLRLVRETRRALRGFVETSSSDGRFLVSFVPGPDEMAVPYILEAAEATYADLSVRFGTPLAPPIRIEVAPTFGTLAALSGLEEEGLRASGTVAVCRYRKVMLVSPSAFPHGYPYADTVAHELVHFFLISRAGEEGLPVWFQEATAKYLEPIWRGDPPGTFASGLQAILARAIAEGRLLPIHSLSSPLISLGRAEDVALAYAELSSFMSFIVRTRGPEVLPRLADSLSRPGPGDPVIEVLGRPLKTLFEDWAREMTSANLTDLREIRDPAVLLREPDDAIRAGLPSAVARRLRLGDLFRSEGRFKAAVAQYAQARDALPAAHPLVVARLAGALVDDGRPAEALAELDRAGLADDWYPPLARERGRAFVLLDRPRDALRPLLSFVRTNPYDPAVHEGLARVWEALGQPTLAERERRLARFWR